MPVIRFIHRHITKDNYPCSDKEHNPTIAIIQLISSCRPTEWFRVSVVTSDFKMSLMQTFQSVLVAVCLVKIHFSLLSFTKRCSLERCGQICLFGALSTISHVGSIGKYLTLLYFQCVTHSRHCCALTCWMGLSVRGFTLTGCSPQWITAWEGRQQWQQGANG